jgi:hypothetical protein
MNREIERQDGWTRTVSGTAEGNGEPLTFTYDGIMEIRPGCLCHVPADALVVIVQNEDTFELWALRDWSAVGKLVAYYETNRPEGGTKQVMFLNRAQAAGLLDTSTLMDMA